MTLVLAADATRKGCVDRQTRKPPVTGNSDAGMLQDLFESPLETARPKCDRNHCRQMITGPAVCTERDAIRPSASPAS